MLINETIEKLKSMRLSGFVEALEEQNEFSSFQELSFEERLGLLVDREFSRRKSNRIQRLIQQAKFQDPTTCVENIHYGAERKINKQLVLELASGQYIRHARNVNIFGATGAGKSYLGWLWVNALAARASRQDIYNCRIYWTNVKWPGKKVRKLSRSCESTLLIYPC